MVGEKGSWDGLLVASHPGRVAQVQVNDALL